MPSFNRKTLHVFKHWKYLRGRITVYIAQARISGRDGDVTPASPGRASTFTLMKIHLPSSNRRQFLQGLLPGAAAGAHIASTNITWAEEARLQGNFAVFNVLEFGARSTNSAASNRSAIQNAIDKAFRIGGGLVYFPPGIYQTGTVVIKENVSLYLEAGATIYGSTNKDDYDHGCLVYAENAANIAIRGRGVIDGNGKAIFAKGGLERGREREYHAKLRAEVIWRPGRMMLFVKCENLLIEDVTLRNSPGWTVHPIDCDRVLIRGISILNGIYDEDGPNTDGIDPDGCSKVRISDCFIQCGDDAIALKCTTKSSTHACRDISVTNCVLITTETALKLGSETGGEFRNITFANCAIRDAGCGIGLWMRDGGIIDGWIVNNISMTLTDGGTPIYLWAYPRSRLSTPGVPPPPEGPLGVVRNVMISNVVAEADGGIFITGVDEQHMQWITLEDIRLHVRGAREKPLHLDPPYPFLVWGHRHAPYDIFCRYVDDLKLRNIHLTWHRPENPAWGSAIRCRQVRDLEIDGFVGRQAEKSAAPAIWLQDVQNAFIRNCRAPEGTGVFLKIEGDTCGVSLMGNDLSKAEKVFATAQATAARTIFEQGNRPPRTWI